MILPLIAVGVLTAGALLWRSRITRRPFRAALVWTDEGVQYKCIRCAKWHVGIPNWTFSGPDMVNVLTLREYAKRVVRDEDFILLDGKWAFTLALLEMPVHGVAELFGWGVWVALRRSDADRFVDLYNDSNRVAGEVFEGRLGNALPGYPNTVTLPVRVTVRPYPTRPLVEVEDETHPLARHQQAGVAKDILRVALTPLFA